MFEQYLSRWRLQPDGAPIVTHSSHLLPVRRDSEPAMLKVAHESEEKFGGVLMQWWDGYGAARVFEYDGEAILLERAEGSRSLLDMAHNGQDDEASRIMCAVAAQLHAPRNKPLPYLIPLTQWFQELEPAAGKYGGIFVEAAATARELFASPREVGVLHGDIHHSNILDFGPRGWLVIDPKRLLGERGFDFANMLCNPDLATAKTSGRFLRQIDVIARAGNLERRRLLQWTLAYAGLSAAWFFSDGDPAETDLAVAEFAIAALKA